MVQRMGQASEIPPLMGDPLLKATRISIPDRMVLGDEAYPLAVSDGPPPAEGRNKHSLCGAALVDGTHTSFFCFLGKRGVGTRHTP